MTRMTAGLGAVTAAALLAACELVPGPDEDARETPAPTVTSALNRSDPEVRAPDVTPADEPPPAVAGLPEPEATPATPGVPHIYMALQPGGRGHPTSVIFAIDESRDGTPSDDPAVRLTPDAGDCNPQELRRYDFAPEAATPVVSEPEQERGLTARDLPSYLAASVTGRLLEAGLASEAEETRPLNVCTRKLWERLVTAESRTAQSGH